MISPELINALGWTLLHSLWQGTVLALLMMVLIRMGSSRRANIRYAVSVGALASLVFSMVVTFCLLYSPASEGFTKSDPLTYESILPFPNHEFEITQESQQWMAASFHWINANINMIVLGWALGMVLFSFRLIGGLVLVYRLKKSSKPVAESAIGMLRQLMRSLSLSNDIGLAESDRIDVPVVIGYLKPVILFPIGLMASLSTQQVEAVLLHELSHIKRHDFLINLMQSAVEVVLFFNPFVWIISSSIRTERENCCDDVVVKHINNPMTYAHTLFQIEQIRQHHVPMAMAISGNKNQLFNRIQRIMEKSIHNNATRIKAWPIVLLVITGLVCASWMSINTLSNQDEPRSLKPVEADTTINKNKESKSATYSRKSVTVVDELGNPHEEVTEEFEGDESLRPFLDIDEENKMFEPWTSTNDSLTEYWSSGPFSTDTLPDRHFKSARDWEEFSREFSQRFQEQFKDFYSEHGEEFEKLFKDMRIRLNGFEERFDQQWAFKMDEKLQHEMERMEETMRDLPLKQEELMHLQQESMKRLEERLKETNFLMEETSRNLQAFDAALKEQLVKDGYLDKNENIETINWGENSELKVNGKKIKETDQPKYQEIRKKYFNGHRRPGKPQ